MRPFAIYLYGPGAGPLPSRFEDVAERLAATERLYFEWDGSFVWRGTTDEGAWQIDGALYDRGERVQYVDLKGRCPRSAWNALLEILAGSPAAAVSILMLPARQAVDRQRFEEEIWENPAPPDPLA